MTSRREVLLTLTASLLAATVMIMPVRAEESFGVITQVALDRKQVTLLTERGEKLELETKDSTLIVNGKDEKVSLEVVAKGVAKAIENGTKGIFAKVKYEKNIASRMAVGLPEATKAKSKK